MAKNILLIPGHPVENSFRKAFITSIKLNIMTHQARVQTVALINPKKGFNIHLLVFLLATPLIWLVWYLTDRTYPWPLWSTAAWVIGVLFHFLGVFVFKKSTANKMIKPC